MIAMTPTVRIRFDGACEPVNPGGTGAYAWIVSCMDFRVDPPEWKEHKTGSGTLPASPAMTNNVAEWTALGFALRYLWDFHGGKPVKPRRPDAGLLIEGDSKLVVCQLTGEWRCNDERLRRYRDRCLQLLKDLGIPWTVGWVPRRENHEADTLCREAWEGKTGRPMPERVSHRSGAKAD